LGPASGPAPTAKSDTRRSRAYLALANGHRIVTSRWWRRRTAPMTTTSATIRRAGAFNDRPADSLGAFAQSYPGRLLAAGTTARWTRSSRPHTSSTYEGANGAVDDAGGAAGRRRPQDHRERSVRRGVVSFFATLLRRWRGSGTERLGADARRCGFDWRRRPGESERPCLSVVLSELAGALARSTVTRQSRRPAGDVCRKTRAFAPVVAINPLDAIASLASHRGFAIGTVVH
jgi:hypothetical protein